MRRIGLAGALAMLLTLVGLTFAAPGAVAASDCGQLRDRRQPPSTLQRRADRLGHALPHPNRSRSRRSRTRSCKQGRSSTTARRRTLPGRVVMHDRQRAPEGRPARRPDRRSARSTAISSSTSTSPARATTATPHIDYELNQSGVATRSARRCRGARRRHRPAFDTNNGGATITVNAYRWVDDAITPGSLHRAGDRPDGRHVGRRGQHPNSDPAAHRGRFRRGRAEPHRHDRHRGLRPVRHRVFMKTRSSTSIELGAAGPHSAEADPRR